MHVSLGRYLTLPPDERKLVTSIDASDLSQGPELHVPYEFEEYPGEVEARGTDHRGYNK